MFSTRVEYISVSEIGQSMMFSTRVEYPSVSEIGQSMMFFTRVEYSSRMPSVKLMSI